MDKADDERRLDRGVTVGSIASSSTAAEAAVAIKCEKDSTVRILGDAGAAPDATRRMQL
jgi:cobalamin biosynthesis protein CbiD